MDVSLLPNEHIETIGRRLQLIVSPAHTFGTDALLLAAFSAPPPAAKVCDLGTGCGILPFYWLAGGLREVSAVELQAAACSQLRRSAARSGVADRVDVVESDLNDLRGRLPFGVFDLVTMNPPYLRAGHGAQSSDPARSTARHETAAALPGICAAAAKLLKFGGRFCICMPPDRLAEAICAMDAEKLTPKRLRFVAQRPGSAPWLFLLEGKKGRKPGLTMEPEFYLRTADGAESDAWLQVLGDYGKDD